MPPAKKDPTAAILNAALPLIAERGLSVTIEDVAASAGMEPAAVRERFEEPVDALHEAFRRGQKDMEKLYRTPVMGDLNAHMEVLFDGMMLTVRPFGPETYLGIVYRATYDPVLREIIRRESGKLGFAVKAFMAEMVAMAIVEHIDQVERVNQALVSSFIEHLALVLEGKKLPAIRKAWVKQAAALFQPSLKTSPLAGL